MHNSETELSTALQNLVRGIHMHLYIYNIKMLFFPIQKYLSTISNTLIDIRDMMKAYQDGQSNSSEVFISSYNNLGLYFFTFTAEPTPQKGNRF